MKLTLWLLVLSLACASAFAQVEVTFAPFGSEDQKPTTTPRQPPHQKCCVPMVYDSAGKLLGEVIKYDERFPTVPLNAWVRYQLAGGDSVAINVGAEAVNAPITLGGSAVVFTSNDCSGDAFVAALGSPTLTKRYSVVLPQGGASPGPWTATNAWLYVTDPFPARVNAGATVYHSQWDIAGCVPYPSPFTFAGPTWGFVMHKVEDLYAKYKRPFYIP